VTLKLLNHFEIKKPMVSYYEHNIRERGEYILARIQAGESCAIVSDAGMPCISDPGEDLVRICSDAGVKIVVVPGPSAVISALAISGLKTSRFTFEGFLSTTKSSRFTHLNSLIDEQRTMIFYEAPHKLLNTLNDMLAILGDRKIAVARELTKIYEEVVRTNISGAIQHFKENSPKGEFVLILEGAKEKIYTFQDAVDKAKELVANGEKATEAAKTIAKEMGFKKSDIYQELL
ncbi:MAG: 16S rRNA (cytidine(1402)-2'-O)-methyltransferase, partial [Oscillospiraceae bacterium]